MRRSAKGKLLEGLQRAIKRVLLTIASLLRRGLDSVGRGGTMHDVLDRWLKSAFFASPGSGNVRVFNRPGLRDGWSSIAWQPETTEQTFVLATVL